MWQVLWLYADEGGWLRVYRDSFADACVAARALSGDPDNHSIRITKRRPNLRDAS